MLNHVERNLKKLFSWLNVEKSNVEKPEEPGFGLGKGHMKIIRKGSAMRVIFFYPGEEGTYVDNANVILYENGIVHISSNQEETTTHLQNCEILWRFETDAEERVNKVRLLKPKTESRTPEDRSNERSGVNVAANVAERSDKSEKAESKSGKGNSTRNPELVE